MTNRERIREGLVLGGLDGANPLAFLAALGTLRGLTIACSESRVCLYWSQEDAWRPTVQVNGGSPTQEEVLDALDRFIDMRPGHDALSIGNNPSVPASEFHDRACAVAEAASPSFEDRAATDFMAAFGCEAVIHTRGTYKGLIQDTALRTMSGTGHQYFLKTMRDLTGRATVDHLRRSLFEPWRRQDPQFSLRWDPEEDRRYALRWKDPSEDKVSAKGERSGAPTEWGANRLAFEALPLFPVMPLGPMVQTTGFSGNRSKNTFWTWPIWDAPIGLDTVRSLLALRKLRGDNLAHEELAAMGIVQVFRSRRITTGQYRNFTPSAPV